MANILIVEDDASVREALVDLLQSVGLRSEAFGSVQAFLVGGVYRIVNMNWEEIHPPPQGTGRDHYLTAVTRVDNQLVEIIDVEKILAEVAPTPETISVGVVDADLGGDERRGLARIPTFRRRKHVVHEAPERPRASLVVAARARRPARPAERFRNETAPEADALFLWSAWTCRLTSTRTRPPTPGACSR